MTMATHAPFYAVTLGLAIPLIATMFSCAQEDAITASPSSAPAISHFQTGFEPTIALGPYGNDANILAFSGKDSSFAADLDWDAINPDPPRNAIYCSKAILDQVNGQNSGQGLAVYFDDFEFR